MLGRAGADGRFEDVERNPDVAAGPGVVILRVESGLFFANADIVRESIRAKAADPNVRAVVLDAETIPASTPRREPDEARTVKLPSWRHKDSGRGARLWVFIPLG